MSSHQNRLIEVILMSTQFEIDVANEPSVLGPLKFYCISWMIFSYFSINVYAV